MGLTREDVKSHHIRGTDRQWQAVNKNSWGAWFRASQTQDDSRTGSLNKSLWYGVSHDSRGSPHACSLFPHVLSITKPLLMSGRLSLRAWPQLSPLTRPTISLPLFPTGILNIAHAWSDYNMDTMWACILPCYPSALYPPPAYLQDEVLILWQVCAVVVINGAGADSPALAPKTRDFSSIVYSW